MSASFESLLELSRLEAGAVQPHTRADVSLAVLCDEVVSELQPEAVQAGRQLSLECEDEVVVSDPVLLRRVLEQLVRHAIDSVERGVVQVTCTTQVPVVTCTVRTTVRSAVAHTQRSEPRPMGLAGAVVDRTVELLTHRPEAHVESHDVHALHLRMACGRGAGVDP